MLFRLPGLLCVNSCKEAQRQNYMTPVPFLVRTDTNVCFGGGL